MAVIVTPEPGQAAAVGQRLLALAADPREVVWVSWPQSGFQISEELFAAFENFTGFEAAAQSPESTPQQPEAEQNTPVLAAPKRRGRPRKHPVTTDKEQ